MREEKNEKAIFLLSILLFVLFGLWMFVGTSPYLGMADINATINTTVNITNSAPEVRTAVMPSSINLQAYDNTTVQCNVTVYDYDNNTAGVNATLYYYLNDPNDADDNNYKYTNASCAASSVWDYAMNFTCAFSVAFYANNGTWYCNATAWDTYGVNGTNVSNAGIINPLVAIYAPGVIDYGQLGQGEISESMLANLTNAGNRQINITVEGWGSAKGDNLSMNCTYGEIAVQYEKYNVTNQTYASMIALTGAPVKIPDLYVLQRTNDTLDSTNVTYWRLEIPSQAGGTCTGKILFTASDYYS